MTSKETSHPSSLVQMAKEIFRQDPQGPITKASISALRIDALHRQLTIIGQKHKKNAGEASINQAMVEVLTEFLLTDSTNPLENNVIEIKQPDNNSSALSQLSPPAFRVITDSDPFASNCDNLTFENALSLARQTNGQVVPVICNGQLVRLTPPSPDIQPQLF